MKVFSSTIYCILKGKANCQGADVKVNFRVPALHIETGLDPVGLVPCAPAYMSNARFYNAWQGPIWQLNATKVGHMDLANEVGVISTLSRLVCKSTHDKLLRADYRRTIAATVWAFAHGLVSGQMQLTASVLDGTIKAPVDVEYQNSLKGLKPADIRLSCSSV